MRRNRFVPALCGAREMDLDEALCDDNEIEEAYLSEKLLVRLRRMDKYEIFTFKTGTKFNLKPIQL